MRANRLLLSVPSLLSSPAPSSGAPAAASSRLLARPSLFSAAAPQPASAASIAAASPSAASPRAAASFSSTPQPSSRWLMELAAIAWQTLTPKQRSAWQDFASRHHSLFRTGQDEALGAYHIYCSAAINRLLLGADPPTDAPLQSPPAPPLDLWNEPTPAPRCFRFVVTHPLNSSAVSSDADGASVSAPVSALLPAPAPAAHALVVRITSPVPASDPSGIFMRDARLICGFSPLSARHLPASGESVQFDNARFDALPGERFGVLARIIRIRDGLASPPLFRIVG